MSADGSVMAVGGEDRLIRLWHLRPRSRTITLRGLSPSEGWSVAFSPDGRTLAAGGDHGRLRLWDVATWSERVSLRKHAALVTSLAFSPDGHTLASVGYDRMNFSMLWDIDSERPGPFLRGHEAYVRSVAFRPDGRTVVTSDDDGRILFWDPADGRRTAEINVRPPGSRCVFVSPDGLTLAAVVSDRMDLIDTATLEIRSIPTESRMSAARFSNDGKLLLEGYDDGFIRAWNWIDGHELWKVQGHAGHVLGLAVSPDGAVLASAGEDKTVRVWDLTTGQELLCMTDFRARVNSVAFSPDGGLLAATDHTGAITIWDARPRR
jgi:WD40 repeat protein